MKRTLFTCACGSIEHSFVIAADDEDMFIEVHLSPLPLWQRVKNAIGYVFGRRSMYGDFEEILLLPDMAVELGDNLLEWAYGDKRRFEPNDQY
jgi:hypothetical protein